MPIKKIEVICLPCHRCEFVINKIRNEIRSLEYEYKIKIKYEFIHNTNLKHMQRYSVNASQTPVVLINDSVEFAGRIEATSIRPKLEFIQKGF